MSITNTEVTRVKVTKVWEGGAPNAPIVVKLEGSDGSAVFHELNAANNWTYTFEKLPIKSDVTYIVVEGSGTVEADGTCANFVAFNTGDDGFEVGGKEYTYRGTVYTNADGTPRDGGLDGSVGPNAGTATITNMTIYSLPSAGGPGVYPFLLIGAFAMAYAASAALDSRRKRFGGEKGR